MKKLLALALMLGCAVAQAETTIGVHLGTYHFNRSARLQEVNPGVYAVIDGHTFGMYHNSYGGTSSYYGYTARNVLGPVDLTVGGVSGYAPGAVVQAMLVPSVKVGSFRVGLVLPRSKGGGALHLSYEL